MHVIEQAGPQESTSMVAWAVAEVANPEMPLASTGLEVRPVSPCISLARR